MYRDKSGLEVLLAPPRIEMAEMITPRDLEKILSLLRRVYSSIVIDMSSQINDINLAFLQALRQLDVAQRHGPHGSPRGMDAQMVED